MPLPYIGTRVLRFFRPSFRHKAGYGFWIDFIGAYGVYVATRGKMGDLSRQILTAPIEWITHWQEVTQKHYIVSMRFAAYKRFPHHGRFGNENLDALCAQ